MKKSCLFLLVVWLGLAAFEYTVLRDTIFAEQYWLPVVLALSVALVIANIMGLAKVISQSRASARSPQSWRDGDLVTVSGRIQALRRPFAAPFSGKESVIAEYHINGPSSENQTSGAADFLGMIMSPCSVHTGRGAVRLVGFPLLAQLRQEELEYPAAYLNAAKYLLGAEFREKPKNPMEMLKQLGAILSDDDGDLKVDFKDSRISLSTLVSSSDTTEDEGMRSAPASISAEALANYLTQRDCTLQETIIPNGAEVTISGTYRATKQQIDIGSGLKHLHHELHLGALSQVLRKQFSKNILALGFWSVVCAGAHLYVAKESGLLSPELAKALHDLWVPGLSQMESPVEPASTD